MIKNKINELGNEQKWNHNITLPDGTQTSPGKQTSHGKNLVKWQRIESLLNTLNLKNKKVLDLGCNEGFFSFEMAEKGALVSGIDIDPLRIKKANFVKSVFDVNNPTFNVIDIYSEEFKNLEQFDFCLCMGFVHRIPDPYSAIRAIGDKTDTILFEWKALKQGHHSDSIAMFSKKDIDNIDYYGTEYWLLTYNALETILKRNNFKFFYKIDDPRQRRAILVASKKSNELFDKKDQIIHRGRIITFLSHTKKYLKTIFKIFQGKINS